MPEVRAKLLVQSLFLCCNCRCFQQAFGSLGRAEKDLADQLQHAKLHAQQHLHGSQVGLVQGHILVVYKPRALYVANAFGEEASGVYWPHCKYHTTLLT